MRQDHQCHFDEILLGVKSEWRIEMTKAAGRPTAFSHN
jgi:hypothetical protein